MRKYRFLISASLFFLLSSCASMKPIAFADGTPTLEPVAFFGGSTRSSGVVENSGGKPTTRITTQTQGNFKDGILYIEQDLQPEGRKSNHRSWQLRQVDVHHVEGTANDISGTAHGLLYGNHFSWTFRHKLSGRKFIRNVRMSQSMYLMPDGKTMIIRSIIRKFGIKLVGITEEFRKE
jgi:hypothetical protein